jgi:2-oxoglutarate ferredoxin oxidoreductase subunit alpha
MLIPGTINECFEFGWKAFDLAERLQTPIFVLSDLDLGMNLWIADPLEYPDQAMDRGKVLSEEDLNNLGEFARYRDVDGDGITYRTLPGNRHPLSAWFARGTGHNEEAVYSERPEDWVANMTRIMLKHETAREFVPPPIIDNVPGSNVGIIAYGSTDPVVLEARDRLSKDGINTDYLRIRALPFTRSVAEFIREHDVVYVIEMNFEGQMHQLLQLEVPDQAAKILSLSNNDGLPLSAGWITTAVTEVTAERS